jgi:transcriptional regulator with XRE-family HTH domain
MADDEESGGLPHLADRLNVLFARVPRRNSHQTYSNERAAEELTDAGVSVTGAYLSALRSGRRNNPSARLLAAIAELFEVPITYFFDDEQARKIESQLNTLGALRSAGVRGIVARSAGVSEEGLANLAAILEQLRKVEGLDDEEPSRE